jgi:hemin uptake protein HemP
MNTLKTVLLTVISFCLISSLVLSCSKDDNEAGNNPTPVQETKVKGYSLLETDEFRPAMTSVFVKLDVDNQDVFVNTHQSGDCNKTISTSKDVAYRLEVKYVGEVNRIDRASGVLSATNFTPGCNEIEVMHNGAEYVLYVNGRTAITGNGGNNGGGNNGGGNNGGNNGGGNEEGPARLQHPAACASPA